MWISNNIFLVRVTTAMVLTHSILSVVYGQRQTFQDTVKSTTLVKFEHLDSTHGYKDPHMPDTLSATFHLSGEVISLHLYRMDQLDSVPLYVISKYGEIINYNETGRREKLPSQVIGYYQSSRHGGSFILTNDYNNFYTMEGVFAHKNQKYYISTDRNAHPIHAAFNNPSEHNVVEHTIRTLTPNPSSSFDSLQISNVLPVFEREKRETGSPTLYEVETLLVVDYSVYRFWYDLSPGTTAEKRQADAFASIKTYFSYLVNSVDIRYQSIKEADMAFRVLFTGILIMTTTADSSWTEENKVDGMSKVDVDAALTSFTDWIKTANVPAHDHAVLITRHRLFEVNSERAGLAIEGAICTDKSTSISRNTFDFGGFLTAAHELGHSLGANHDESTIDCRSMERYIMTQTYTQVSTPENILHPWQFSPCSINSFRQKIAELNKSGTNCLRSRESPSVLPVPTPVPGQYYDVDQICRYTFGTYLCRASYESDNVTSVCDAMLCRDPTKDGCTSMTTPDGISCGDKMWCSQGLCVFSNDAPEMNGSCPFGDTQGLNCAQLVRDSYNCYNENFRKSCCESCSAIERSKPTCKYGDRGSVCVGVRPYQCYHSENENLCCETCLKWQNSSNIACRYGDRSPTCDGITPHQCYSSTNERLCCESCPKWKNSSDAGCPYGDRNIPECPKIKKRQCYTNSTFTTCCKTCSDWSTGPPECPWGDKASDCDQLSAAQCSTPQWQDVCCSTCKERTNTPCRDRHTDCATLERRFCYNNQETCCARCAQLFNPNLTDCEYGDRSKECVALLTDPDALERCNDGSIKSVCCQTCQDLDSSPVTTSEIPRTTKTLSPTREVITTTLQTPAQKTSTSTENVGSPQKTSSTNIPTTTRTSTTMPTTNTATVPTRKKMTETTTTKITTVSTTPKITTVPTTPKITTVPTTPKITTVPTTPKITTIPTTPKITTVPTTPKITTVPTTPKITTVPTTSKITTVPTTPKITTIPTTQTIKTIPTIPIITTVPTTPKITTVPTTPKITTVPTTPKVTAIPTTQTIKTIPTTPIITTVPTTPKITTVPTTPKITTVPSKPKITTSTAATTPKLTTVSTTPKITTPTKTIVPTTTNITLPASQKITTVPATQKITTVPTTPTITVSAKPKITTVPTTQKTRTVKRTPKITTLSATHQITTLSATQKITTAPTTPKTATIPTTVATSSTFPTPKIRTVPPSALSTEEYIGLGVGVFAFINVTVLALCCWCRRKKTTKPHEQIQKPSRPPVLLPLETRFFPFSSVHDTAPMKYARNLPRLSPTQANREYSRLYDYNRHSTVL